MPNWLQRTIGNTAAAAKAPGEAVKAPTSVWTGSALLRRSRVETPELGPLARLQPFAPVILRLLETLQREDISLIEIAGLVEGDPALTAEILGVVNSPLYPVRGEITSPAHGILLLGVDQIKALATTLALRSMLSGSPRTSVMRRFWRHSVASAAIAQQLAPAFDVNKSLGYTAAVVHDLGRLGLLAAHREAYGCLAAGGHESVENILAVEQARFGMDHCHAGLLLSRAWGLPMTLQTAIAHHHRPCCESGVLGLVHAACLLADTFTFESIPYENRLPSAEIVRTCVPEASREQVTGALERLKLITLETIGSFDF